MPSPIFDAPLTSSLVPVTAGNGTATFTRATTAYVSAVAAAGNAVDGEVLILCDAGEARFAGARRISANNWSPLYADGSAIPAATLLGYVAENAATNLCLQSQTFDVAPWTQSNAIAANDATVAAPDGTPTADKFTDNATNAAHQCYQPVGVGVIGTVYTYSVYLKAGTLTWAQIALGAAGTDRWGNFNLVTGTVGNKGTAVTASTITALPNGWYRCSITLPSDGSPCYTGVIGSNANSAAYAPAYVGTGQTMYLWGAQVETGSDPSSYIATTTVAVTRAVDVLSYQATSNVGATVGTAYAEFVSIPAVADTPTRGIVTLEAVGSYPLARTSGGQISNYDGTGVVTTVNLLTPKTLNKTAARWGAAGQRGIVLNGGAIVNAAFDGNMNGTLLQIGNWAGTSTIFGTVSNVKIYSVALTDAQLIQLTTDGFLPPDVVPVVPSTEGGIGARVRRYRRIEVEIDGEIFPVASEEEGRELLLKAREAAKQAAQAAAVRAAAKAEKKTSPAAVERALALSTPRISLRADDRSEALAQAIQSQVDAAQAAIDEDYATARRMAYAYVRQRLQDEQRQRELAADEEEVIAMILRLP